MPPPSYSNNATCAAITAIVATIAAHNAAIIRRSRASMLIIEGTQRAKRSRNATGRNTDHHVRFDPLSERQQIPQRHSRDLIVSLSLKPGIHAEAFDIDMSVRAKQLASLPPNHSVFRYQGAKLEGRLGVKNIFYLFDAEDVRRIA